MRDEAAWAYEDGTLRPGLPRNETVGDDPTTPGDDRLDQPSVEYDFLIGVELDDFRKDDELGHGPGGEDRGDPAREGNSHPHRGEDDEHLDADGECAPGGDGTADQAQGCERSFAHDHSASDLEVYFNRSAPDFVEENAYWGASGQPPPLDEDCSQATGGDPERQEAIEERSFRVCDREAESPYHAHDGSQTIGRPS